MGTRLSLSSAEGGLVFWLPAALASRDGQGVARILDGETTRLEASLDAAIPHGVYDVSERLRLWATIGHDGLKHGGAIARADPESGFSLDIAGRRLVALDDDGRAEWGIAARLGWDPAPETARGPSVSMRQERGRQGRWRHRNRRSRSIRA